MRWARFAGSRGGGANLLHRPLHAWILAAVAAAAWSWTVLSGQTGSAPAADVRPALYVTAVASTLVGQGLALAAPGDAEAAAFESVPHPGVRFVPNVARATNVPWIDSNGWRFQRGVRRAFYSKLPQGSAPLAAAEAFAYGVSAILNPDPADVEALGGMLRFLKGQEQPPLPPMANIGIVDDSSPVMGEVLNLLTRRNLLYRVVPAPDPSLDLTVRLGTPEFPLESAANPYEFAARIRERLGDENRLVRLYGTNTAIARLTGDGKRARLCLLAFSGSRRQQQARNPQAIRVRLLGQYRPVAFAAYGSAEGAALTDLRTPERATEFWVPDFTTLAIVDLEAVR
jgi:hypothetical protein